MTNPRLVQMKEEFDANRGGLDYLDALAAQEKRPLSADEQIAYDRAVVRNDELATQIPEFLDRDKRYDVVADATAHVVAPEAGRSSVHADGTARDRLVTYDASRAAQPFRHGVAVEEMGRFALEVGRAKLGRVTGKMSADEASEVLNRWDVDPSNELGRVVAHGIAADGTAPVTIEGDLIKFVDANRYAVNAVRQLPMPDNHAPTFKRPRTTQRTTVAQQVTEGDVLSSQRLQNTGDTVTKTTQGGVLSLSEQEIDWTDPAMLGLAIEDLAQSYAIATDKVLTAALEVAFTASVQTVVSNTATAAVFTTQLAAAIVACYGTAKQVPDTLFVALDRWGYLAGLTDTTGRPIFPPVGPQNASGSNGGALARFTGFNIMGLNVVVDPNFTTGVWAVGVSSLAEFYEENKGLLSVNVPSTLEVQYAYRGYVAANVYTQGVNALETS